MTVMVVYSPQHLNYDIQILRSDEVMSHYRESIQSTGPSQIQMSKKPIELGINHGL